MDKFSITRLLRHESGYWAQGLSFLAGVDEAGRGPLAGPVVAAAVVLPRNRKLLNTLQGLTDSKLLTPAQRNRFFERIGGLTDAIGLGIVPPDIIDRINIRQATFLAMRRALACLSRVDLALVDGPWHVPGLEISQKPLVRGDSLSLSIAAASVVAKVLRDRLMTALAEHYPAFAFEANKGYPTAAHRRTIKVEGLSPLHRRSFCKKIVGTGQ